MDWEISVVLYSVNGNQFMDARIEKKVFSSACNLRGDGMIFNNFSISQVCFGNFGKMVEQYFFGL